MLANLTTGQHHVRPAIGHGGVVLAQTQLQAEEPLRLPLNAAPARVMVNLLSNGREAPQRAKALRYVKNRAQWAVHVPHPQSQPEI